MLKKSWGDVDYRLNECLIVVKWNGNSAAALCSNSVNVRLLFPVRRWTKDAGKVLINTSPVIKACHGSVGGVHTVYQELGKFCLAVIKKKQYFPLLVNGLNIGLVYAWCLY